MKPSPDTVGGSALARMFPTRFETATACSSTRPYPSPLALSMNGHPSPHPSPQPRPARGWLRLGRGRKGEGKRKRFMGSMRDSDQGILFPAPRSEALPRGWGEGARERGHAGGKTSGLGRALQRFALALALWGSGAGLALAEGAPAGWAVPPAGGATAAVVALAGVVAVGAGTAGLLLLRALAGWREGAGAGIPVASSWRSLGRACVESGFLGGTACCLGLFLLAFMGLATQPEPETVLLPVLSSLMIVDGRALLLAFATVATLVLIWGGASTLRAALDSLRVPLVGWGGPRSHASSGHVRVLRVLVPVGVGIGLLVSTTWAVQRGLVLVAAGARPSVQPSVLVQRSTSVRPGGFLRGIPLSGLSSFLFSGGGFSILEAVGPAEASGGDREIGTRAPAELPVGTMSLESPSAS